MNNRIVFIIPFRNVKEFIKDCYTSILAQSYHNWIAIFCDDASTDGTLNELPNDSRFIIRRNENRITALPNIHFGIMESGLSEEDVICILDGDDFLIRKDAIDIINSLYQDDTLLTYGQYVWSNGQIGHCKPYTFQEFKNLRSGGYWASHMRTFKYKLYLEILNQDPDLNCFRDENGEFFTMSCDVATMTPLMEIAGLEQIKFNPVPIYFYRIHIQNDHNMNASLQKKIEQQIFNKKSFIKNKF
jgi:glycosyltransferase involved in cell wall biosynthesis